MKMMIFKEREAMFDIWLAFFVVLVNEYWALV